MKNAVHEELRYCCFFIAALYAVVLAMIFSVAASVLAVEVSSFYAYSYNCCMYASIFRFDTLILQMSGMQWSKLSV